MASLATKILKSKQIKKNWYMDCVEALYNH